MKAETDAMLRCARRMSMAASIAVLGMLGLGCLTPGQTYNVGEQLDQIREQAEQVRSAQRSNAESIVALQTAEPLLDRDSSRESQMARAPRTLRDEEPPLIETDLGVGPQGAESSSRSPDEGMFRQGYALYHRRDYQGAELLLRRFLEADLEGPMADDAQFWIAECRFARGLYRDAMLEYRDLIERYPDSHRVPRAWFMIALCYERLGDTEAMDEHLTLVAERFPDSDVAPLARDRLGRR